MNTYCGFEVLFNTFKIKNHEISSLRHFIEHLWVFSHLKNQSYKMNTLHVSPTFFLLLHLQHKLGVFTRHFGSVSWKIYTLHRDGGNSFYYRKSKRTRRETGHAGYPKRVVTRDLSHD